MQGSKLVAAKLVAEDGQTNLELGLILVILSIALIGSLTLLSGGLDTIYEDIVLKLGGILSP